MGEEQIQAEMALMLQLVSLSWAQGDEKLLTAFIHNLQRITLPVVGTLYCSLLYLQGYEHSRHSGNTCWMDEVILFNSLPLHWEEKHKLLSMPWIILPTSPNSNPDTHSYIHWTTVAPANSPFSASQTCQTSPWAYLHGTLTFTLQLAFHPSIFRLNGTPLEGPFLILSSKGNRPLILSPVFSNALPLLPP